MNLIMLKTLANAPKTNADAPIGVELFCGLHKAALKEHLAKKEPMPLPELTADRVAAEKAAPFSTPKTLKHKNSVFLKAGSGQPLCCLQVVTNAVLEDPSLEPVFGWVDWVGLNGKKTHESHVVVRRNGVLEDLTGQLSDEFVHFTPL